jgi:hypothetical protein
MSKFNQAMAGEETLLWLREKTAEVLPDIRILDAEKSIKTRAWFDKLASKKLCNDRVHQVRTGEQKSRK